MRSLKRAGVHISQSITEDAVLVSPLTIPVGEGKLALIHSVVFYPDSIAVDTVEQVMAVWNKPVKDVKADVGDSTANETMLFKDPSVVAVYMCKSAQAGAAYAFQQGPFQVEFDEPYITSLGALSVVFYSNTTRVYDYGVSVYYEIVAASKEDVLGVVGKH